MIAYSINMTPKHDNSGQSAGSIPHWENVRKMWREL